VKTGTRKCALKGLLIHRGDEVGGDGSIRKKKGSLEKKTTSQRDASVLEQPVSRRGLAILSTSRVKRKEKGNLKGGRGYIVDLTKQGKK